MSGRVIHGRTLRGHVQLSADVVIAGGGAGGCMAARELARAGRDVVLLEAGPDLLPGSFTQREDEMIPLLFQQAGGQRTEDLSIVVVSGRGLGGSTLHNQNLCKRTPDALLSHWEDDLGVQGAGPRTMAPFYEEVERDLGVVEIPAERINKHNQVIRRGVEALGYRGGVLRHNRDERCIGSGFCELGCVYNGKLNARRVLVPQALHAGARLYTDVHVARVHHRRGRATGVEGEARDETGARCATVAVEARAVCLGGSAIGSATLALRSGLPNRFTRIGRGLRIHPAALVAGRFEERIEAWHGIPQSYECTEVLDLRPGSERRVWLIPSFSHPAAAAALMPGFGPDLVQGMESYAHLAVLAAMVHDETEGQVVLPKGRVQLRYVPVESDREQLALGIREGARVLLAAGAIECIVPAVPPITIRGEADLAQVTADRFLPHDGKLAAVHPMGTLPMGPDPQTSATDSRGAVHDIEGLYAVDGSLFPTSIGVPPQISIYTFAMKVARGLAATL